MTGAFARGAQALDAQLARLPRESRPRRIAWLAIAVLMTAVPIAFNATREPTYTGSVELFPRAAGPLPPVEEVRYYERLLADPDLRAQLRATSQVDDEAYDDVEVRAFPPRRTVILDVERSTPEQASEFANELAIGLAGSSGRQAAQEAADRAEAAAELLRSGRGDPVARRTVREDLPELRRLARAPEQRIALGPPIEPPALTHWADRMVDKLPGGFTGRPSPVWAGVAGLFAAFVLWAGALVLLPPRSAP